jgi:hypothetical protein
MPLCLQKLLSRSTDASPLARDGRYPEYAGFNPPSRSDLQVLLPVRTDPLQDIRR